MPSFWPLILTILAHFDSVCRIFRTVADPGLRTEGKVERRRREYRGAEGAEGVGCEKFFDFYRGAEGAEGVGCEKFFDFRSKNVDF